MKVIGSALSPTGKHATWWHSGDNKRDKRVRDYDGDQIFDYIVDNGLIRDRALAKRIADRLHRELYDWNEGTDCEVTWDQLIRAAIMQHRESMA